MKIAIGAALLMAASCLSAVPASAAQSLPVLPGPVVSASVSACTTTPCQNDFSVGAGASSVPLPQFGQNYTVTTVDLSHNPTIFTNTQSTPGQLSVGDVGAGQYSITTANGSPKVTASEANVTGVGGLITDLSLTYYFEVVPDLGQGNLTPVTVGVTASGMLSGSTTSTVNTFDVSDSASVTAQLVIGNVLNEIAQARYSYVCLVADNDCSQTSNSSTSNVTVNMGATSTFSGDFNLVDSPLSILTGQAYEVTMNAEMSFGDFPGSATASVDPMITVPVGYTLVLSPGISDGVPEPATWATMLAGFGALGSLLRRRKVQAAARAA